MDTISSKENRVLFIRTSAREFPFNFWGNKTTEQEPSVKRSWGNVFVDFELTVGKSASLFFMEIVEVQFIYPYLKFFRNPLICSLTGSWRLLWPPSEKEITLTICVLTYFWHLCLCVCIYCMSVWHEYLNDMNCELVSVRNKMSHGLSLTYVLSAFILNKTSVEDVSVASHVTKVWSHHHFCIFFFSRDAWIFSLNAKKLRFIFVLHYFMQIYRSSSTKYRNVGILWRIVTHPDISFV